MISQKVFLVRTSEDFHTFIKRKRRKDETMEDALRRLTGFRERKK